MTGWVALIVGVALGVWLNEPSVVRLTEPTAAAVMDEPLGPPDAAAGAYVPSSNTVTIVSPTSGYVYMCNTDASPAVQTVSTFSRTSP